MKITRDYTRGLLALLSWQLLFPLTAGAYSVKLRWDAPADTAVAAYQLYVRADGAAFGAPRDVVLDDATDGALSTTIDDLAVERTYTFALSAVAGDGHESERSNERTIGYAEAAQVVDSDRDGLPDAAEDLNLNGIQDAGETDRLRADSDDDMLTDGVELSQATDALDPASPACAVLPFTDFAYGRGGVAAIAYDPEIADTVLSTSSTSRSPLRFRASYPAKGVVSLAAGALATELRSTNRFRLELTVRSTAGKRYKLRYEGNGGVSRRAGRTLTVALGTEFAARDAYVAVSRDLAADLTTLAPNAVLATVSQIRITGAYSARALRMCS